MMKHGDSEDSSGSSGGKSSAGESQSDDSTSADNQGETGSPSTSPNEEEEDEEDEEGSSGERGEQAVGVNDGESKEQAADSEILAGTTHNADDATSYQKRWAELYQRLKDYKQKHGHCRVPNRYEEDPQLGYWVSTQRRQRRLMNTAGNDTVPLSVERAKKLEDIGFEWSAVPLSHKSWDGRYAELCDFVAKKGHAQVPMGYDDNPRLATWVSTQRQEYKLLKQGRSSRLTEEKKKKLDSVGFVWEAQRGRRKSKKDAQGDEQEEKEDERKPPAIDPPKARLKEPPPETKKKAQGNSSGDIPEQAKAQPSTAQQSPASELSIRQNAEQAIAQFSSVGSEVIPSTAPSIADAVSLDRVRSLLSRPTGSQTAAGLPASSTLPRALALSLSESAGVQPHASAHLPTTAATIDSDALLRTSFTLNQPNSLSTSAAMRHAAASTDTSMVRRPMAATLEQDLLRHLTSSAVGRGQGLGYARPPTEESALQNLLLRRSNLAAANVQPHGGTNLANLFDVQSRQRADQHLLQQTTLLQQLAQQQQEQQRQLQQLEAMRTIQALSAPAPSASQLSQALGLNLPTSSHLPTSSLLLHQSAASSNLGLNQRQSLHPAPQQDHLSLQNLVQQLDGSSMEEIQQAQLRAARQLDTMGALQVGLQQQQQQQLLHQQQRSTVASLEQKVSEEGGDARVSGSNRKRPADQSGNAPPKSHRRF